MLNSLATHMINRIACHFLNYRLIWSQKEECTWSSISQGHQVKVGLSPLILSVDSLSSGSFLSLLGWDLSQWHLINWHPWKEKVILKMLCLCTKRDQPSVNWWNRGKISDLPNEANKAGVFARCAQGRLRWRGSFSPEAVWGLCVHCEKEVKPVGLTVFRNEKK